MVIRLASYKDIEGIASVHIRCWRETYKGIVNEVARVIWNPKL